MLAAFLPAPLVPAAPPSQSLLDHPAPAFTVTDFEGHRVRLTDYRGKVVLLNFWATWCAPCQIEMPVFAHWQKDLGPAGLQIIGVSMDDNSSDARHLAMKLGLNYPLAMGNERLGMRYGGVLGLPLTFLIDRQGIVRARIDGETNLNALKHQTEALLGRIP